MFSKINYKKAVIKSTPLHPETCTGQFKLHVAGFAFDRVSVSNLSFIILYDYVHA